MEDAVLELGKLPAASLIKAINGLTGEEQRALRQISTKLVNAVNASGVTVKTVKPKPSSQSAAAITERKNQRLLGQFADAEASARLNMQLWNRGQSLIPTDHAELPKDKVVDEFSGNDQHYSFNLTPHSNSVHQISCCRVASIAIRGFL